METDGVPGPATFQPTGWTVVLKAQDPAAPERRAALETLIRTYWRPVYFFIRRRGIPIEEAKDLTQDFLSRLLDEDFFQNVSKEKGKFRTFLLASLTNHLSNEARHDRAQKRGGGKAPLSLDFEAADGRFPASPESPDATFRRQWALEVIDRALESLARDTAPALFEALKPHLAGGPSYEETARRLGIPVSRLTNQIHAFRRDFRECVRRQVAASVEDPAAVDGEIADLFNSLKA